MTDITILNDADQLVQAGRPRIPLLVGQRLYIERAYTCLRLSQAHIAENIGIAIPRVRRHLIDQGLYEPRTSQRSEARAAMLKQALQAYQDGERVTIICQQYQVNPAELYREIRRWNIPYRFGHPQHRTHVEGYVHDTRTEDTVG